MLIVPIHGFACSSEPHAAKLAPAQRTTETDLFQTHSEAAAALALLGLHLSDYESTVLAVEFNRLAESPVLIAIPLFTIAGYLLSESGSPKRLVRVTEALLGWLHGGLAVVAILACAVFTAFTGASGVTMRLTI